MSYDVQAMRGGARVVPECFGSIMPSEGSPRIGTEVVARCAFPHALERCNHIAKSGFTKVPPEGTKLGKEIANPPWRQ